jgi:VWFA-related protein
MIGEFSPPCRLAVPDSGKELRFSAIPKFTKTIVQHYRLDRLLLPLFLVATVYSQSVVPQFSEASSDDSSNLIYHSTASEVRLMFFATDENNHWVEDLRRDDFAVVDDEQIIRDFRSFNRSTATSLDVVVLIDSSESVQPQLHQEITDVLQLISQWPWSPADDLSVLSFSGLEARIICSGNCRGSFALDRIASLPSGGEATPLFDALTTAADLLLQRRQPDVWPVILLFSDGDDTISKSSFEDALERILASGAQVYTINADPRGQSSKGTATLQRIAETSGGRSIPLDEGASTIFNAVVDDLHSALVVTYMAPKSSSKFHGVRILATHNLNLQFRSRRGYYRQPATTH